MSLPVDGNQAAKPKNVSELVAMNVIVDTLGLEDQNCLICDEKYVSGPSPEFALKLPACGHIFGMECIKTWLSESKNTCPMCRKQILDIEEQHFEYEQPGMEPPTAFEFPQPDDFNAVIDRTARNIADLTEAYLGAEIRLRNIVNDPAHAFRPGLNHLLGSYVRREGSSLGQDGDLNPSIQDQPIAGSASNGAQVPRRTHDNTDDVREFLNRLFARNNLPGRGHDNPDDLREVLNRLFAGNNLPGRGHDNLDAVLEALNHLHGMTHLFELNHDRLHDAAAAANNDNLIRTLTTLMVFTDDYLVWEERFTDAMVRARGTINRNNRNEVLNNLYDLVETHMNTDARLREAVIDHRYHRRGGDPFFYGEDHV